MHDESTVKCWSADHDRVLRVVMALRSDDIACD